MVRPAKFTDIPQIMGLLRTCHASSKYSYAAQNEGATKELLLRAISSHEAVPKIGDTPVFVSGADALTGLIVGCLQPVHFTISEAMVTDLMWFVDRKVSGPRDGTELLAALHAWADLFEAPVKRLHMVSDAIMNPDVLGRMLKQDGYEMTGYIFEKEAG